MTHTHVICGHTCDNPACVIHTWWGDLVQANGRCTDCEEVSSMAEPGARSDGRPVFNVGGHVSGSIGDQPICSLTVPATSSQRDCGDCSCRCSSAVAIEFHPIDTDSLVARLLRRTDGAVERVPDWRLTQA